MSRPRFRVALKNCEGIVMRHVTRDDALALAFDPDSGFHPEPDGSIQANDYRKANEFSPTSITPSDMKLNVGLGGDPVPQEQRRLGYIDPVESARDKIRVWPEVGDVKREVFAGTFCPWPRIYENFTGSTVQHSDSARLEDAISPQVREAWLVRLGLYHLNS
jgi:hypothetical protein